jgi:D-psicose/D-tagatose/L-ribulose 3-epimerase
MDKLNFLVKVLTGSPQELARRTREWGYDGIEFMPNPEDVPAPDSIATAIAEHDVALPVVNTGRMAPQGMALLHDDEAIREKSIRAFKEMIAFAGHFGARVGLGIARGAGIPGASKQAMDQLAGEVFRDLAAHAERHEVVIMLEAADPGVTSYINTMDEAREWVETINSPGFSLMLDTYQLVDAEPSVEYGIRAAKGMATHIHLYDPSRWPPGVLAEGERLDWAHIGKVLREENFQGTGSVVMAPEGDPEPAARKALAYLRQLFSEGDQ